MWAVRLPTTASLLVATFACASLGCRGDASRAGESAGEPRDAAVTPDAKKPEAEPEPEPAQARPKLVVVVVVDQMRADYLERFAADFEHGFKRIRERGHAFTQARHLHGMTETAPGHATISTGSHPSHHGVLSNRWYDPAINQKVPAVDDPSTKDLVTGDSGSASPLMLLREGVGDWLQRAEPKAHVVSISLKDRAAVLMGGKRPDVALWYHDAAGVYTSSSYYGEALPAWASAFNARDRAAELYGEQGWVLSKAAEAYAPSRAETDPAVVTTYNDYALSKRFPHVIEAEGKTPRNVLRDVPFGDQMSLELGLAALEGEALGQDEVPDMLFLSMSGGDYAGHRYGPNSVEVHDYYMRLDNQLGVFLDALDERVGAEHYTLVLTADHGVTPMPEYNPEVETAGRFVGKEEFPKFMAAAAKTVGLAEDAMPELVYTFGPHLMFDAAVEQPLRTKFMQELATVASADPRLAAVWTRDQLLSASQDDPLVAAQLLSFHPERSPDLIVQFEEGVVPYPTGTNHGTAYDYDQRVPLIFMGKGATAGASDTPAASIDIAPTLAGLMGVPVPEGVDGKALSLAPVAKPG